MLVPKAERGCMVVSGRLRHHALLLHASRAQDSLVSARLQLGKTGESLLAPWLPVPAG
jgi:hypothetical protein